VGVTLSVAASPKEFLGVDATRRRRSGAAILPLIKRPSDLYPENPDAREFAATPVLPRPKH